jgi:hypothetical protein
MSKKQRYTVRRLGEVRENLSDWAAVDALSEDDLAEAIRNDSGDEELERGWLERARVLTPGQTSERYSAGDEIPEQEAPR